MKTKLLGLLAGIGISALAVQPAAADFITFTGTGTGNDGALAARAYFTTSSGLLSVTIANTLAASQIHSALWGASER
jgi:hypothetical protein